MPDLKIGFKLLSKNNKKKSIFKPYSFIEKNKLDLLFVNYFEEISIASHKTEVFFKNPNLKTIKLKNKKDIASFMTFFHLKNLEKKATLNFLNN